jgi:hypothetical protein
MPSEIRPKGDAGERGGATHRGWIMHGLKLME